MILVAGATGLLGQEVCRQLVTAGFTVRGLVRESSAPDLLESLRELGVELVAGDLKLRHSLDPACRGARVVITTATTTRSRQQGDSIWSVDRDGSLNLVEAACEAGVEQFKFVSFPPMVEDFPLQQAKRAVEHRLRDSGMPYTILQAVNFMEVWLAPRVGFDVADARARIFGPGTRGNNWISFRDVARFIVAAVDNPEAVDRTFAFGGPQALGQLEVVKIFEELTGRTFTLERVSMGDLFAMKQGTDDPMDQSIAGLMINCARGDNLDLEAVLRVLPVECVTVRQWAERVVRGLD